MKYILWITFAVLTFQLKAQTAEHYIRVHFYYGSKPKYKFRHVEKKHFGGLHGGHVSIQIGDSVFSFMRKGKVHIFAHQKNFHSQWVNQGVGSWVKDTVNGKYCTFIIPVTDDKFKKLKTIQSLYVKTDPYDYAFFGMRCASSTYDVLSQLDMFKRHSHFGMISRIFYPKKLRKRFYKLSEKNKWQEVKHDGNPKRKWERK